MVDSDRHCPDDSISSMGLLRDITTRIKNQQDLENSRLKLKLAMEAENLGFWDWRPQSDELFTNDIFLTILGYAHDAFPVTLKVSAVAGKGCSFSGVK